MAISKIQAQGVIHDIEAASLDTPALIDGVGFDGTSSISHYAVCSTAAATAAKTAYINGFSLVTGAKVSIQFTYGNEASSPTLNVNSTGAIAIMTDGATAAGLGAWGDGAVIDLVYDGSNWVMADGQTAGVGVYGKVALDSEPTQSSTNVPTSGGTYDAIHGLIDSTLEVSGKAADAAVAGARINAAFPQESVAAADVITFPDGADGIPLKSLVVTIPVTQEGSGTPAPDNVRPFVGCTELTVTRAGKNLFDESAAAWVNDSYLDSTDDSVGTNTSAKYSPTFYPIVPGTWTLQLNKGSSANVATKVHFYNADKTFIGYSVVIAATTSTGLKSGTFTAPEGTAFFRVAGTAKSSTTNIQVEEGSFATAYEAYKGINTYPVDWTDDAGTVYGGALDVVTGEMKPFAHLRLGDLSWSYNSGGLFFYASVTDDYRATGATTDVFCPIYAGADVNSSDTTPDKIICFGSGSQIRIRDKAYSSGSAFYNAIKNYYVVYQKRPASQETVMIDPVQVTSLLGGNTVWSDVGTVAATYRADPKMYVDTAIAAAIANL